MSISLLLGIWTVQLALGRHQETDQPRVHVERLDSMFGFGVALDWRA